MYHIYFSNYITSSLYRRSILYISSPQTFWQYIGKCPNCFYLRILLQYLQNINKILQFPLSLNFMQHLMFQPSCQSLTTTICCRTNRVIVTIVPLRIFILFNLCLEDPRLIRSTLGNEVYSWLN